MNASHENPSRHYRPGRAENKRQAEGGAGEALTFASKSARIFFFASRHWPLLLSLFLLLFALLFGLLTGVSPAYPFQKMKYGQLRLEHDREKLLHEKQDYGEERRFIETQRRLASQQRELGKGLLNSGLYADAEEAFAMALALDGNNWQAAREHFKARALRLATGGEYDPALTFRLIEMILNHDSGDPHAHTVLGGLLSGADPKAAEVHYRRALAVDPRATHASFGLANMLMGRGEYQEARALLEEAVAFSPQRSLYRRGLAGLFSQLGDFQAAAEQYQRARDLDENRILGYFQLGEALRMARNLEDAQAYHRMGVALLDRERIANLPGNLTSWVFEVTPVRPSPGYPNPVPYTVYLDTHESKRVYAGMELAASEFLLGREEDARSQVASLPKLPLRERQEIEWLLAQKLQILVDDQQYLAGTVEAFLRLLK